MGNYVIDQVPFMKSAQDANSPILIEGANALMLDLDFGTYPYVTSVSASRRFGSTAANSKSRIPVSEVFSLALLSTLRR